MALVPEHDKCAEYFNVKLLFSECIDQDQGEGPYAEGPIATNPFNIYAFQRFPVSSLFLAVLQAG